MRLSIISIVQPVPRPIIGHLLSRILEADGFPAIAVTGNLLGRTVTMVCTLMPEPVFNQYKMLAIMASLVPPEKRREVFEQMTQHRPTNVATRLDPDYGVPGLIAGIKRDMLDAAEMSFAPGTMLQLTDGNVEELTDTEKHSVQLGLVDGLRRDRSTAENPNHGRDYGDEDPAEFRNGIPTEQADPQDTYPVHRISREV